MRKVILERTSAGKVMDIVHELREQGCVQGTDFDFAYQPEEHGRHWCAVRA